jgi:hypothetical protein
VSAVVIATLLTGFEPDLMLQNGQSSKSVRTLAANKRGRPRKFNRPARAVTLTLPEDTIAALKSIDPDISRAVVRTVEPLVGELPKPPAELSAFGNQAVIIVSPTRAIAEHTGAELVPLPDGRALVTFDQTMSVSEFELRLSDALRDGSLCDHDRETFESLVGILRESRQRDAGSISERSIMVLRT